MTGTLVATVFLIVIVAGWFARRRKLERESWFYQSRCIGCGYMLRGSAERCPECGRPIWL